MINKLSVKCQHCFETHMNNFYKLKPYNKGLALKSLNDAYFEYKYYRALLVDYYGALPTVDLIYCDMVKQLKKVINNGEAILSNSYGESYFTEK